MAARPQEQRSRQVEIPRPWYTPRPQSCTQDLLELSDSPRGSARVVQRGVRLVTVFALLSSFPHSGLAGSQLLRWLLSSIYSSTKSPCQSSFFSWTMHPKRTCGHSHIGTSSTLPLSCDARTSVICVLAQLRFYSSTPVRGGCGTDRDIALPVSCCWTQHSDTWSEHPARERKSFVFQMLPRALTALWMVGRLISYYTCAVFASQICPRHRLRQHTLPFTLNR